MSEKYEEMLFYKQRIGSMTLTQAGEVHLFAVT